MNVKIAEFDEHDRAEIDRALGISKSYGIAADDKVVHSLEERKLLQVTTSPTIRTPNGSKASVSYEAGQGLDRRDDAKPITHEIEIAPTIVSGNEPKIVTEIRYRETTGKGDSQRTREIQTGAKLKPGDTLAFHFSPQPSAHGKNAQAASGVGKLLFVKATIVKPKPAAGEAKPNPRVSYRKSPAQQ
ncbi:MAG TPA: hypothetical protein VMV10_19115 [Pirellulales bacterium]|nr:hypothetical protein [Pirellulales bacterium]